jgi:phage gp36-like protein
MTNRFGAAELLALTDPDDTGAINQTVLTQALTDASSVIDGYLGGRYVVPMASPPPMIEVLCCDIARFRLAQNPTSQMEVRYTAAIDWLDKAAKGTIPLGVDANGNAPTEAAEVEGTNAVFGTCRTRVFDQRNLTDYDYRYGPPLGGYGYGRGNR